MVIGMQRYFACNKNLEISDDDKYHIIKVMRMKKGDQIQIVWDKDTFLCEINEIDNKNTRLRNSLHGSKNFDTNQKIRHKKY